MKDDRRNTIDEKRRTSTSEREIKIMLLAILITFVAFVLRIYRLDFVSLRGDEAFTVIFVQRTWEGLWKGISTIEPNPPLMYLLLRVWIALAGASEFVTRYFSMFFGVLCVPLIYRLAREMFRAHGNSFSPPKRLSVALVAAALIAINPYQIWHSQDVRNYTIWPALSLLALVFFWRWWRLEGRSWTLEVSHRPWLSVLRPWSV
jgi:mannosyltransferase